MVARVALLAVACLVSLACLWDSDTLGVEDKGLPGVLDVVTGRFDRNPPLYYEMRLARVAAEVERNPAKLDLYDDAGVACDRLGRDDEAIEWMRRKAAQLAKRPDREHQYRTHANLGTFLAHRWFAAGASPERIDELQRARDEIAKAIAINPDAHFGRETVQLELMEWLIERIGPASREGESASPRTLGAYLDDQASSDAGRRTDSLPEGRRDRIRGLVGLIVLGNAWESPDTFEALATLLFMDRESYLAAAASARVKELVDAGRKPLGFEGDQFGHGGEATIVDRHKPGLHKDIAALGKAAEARSRQREAYLLTRLKAGRHPDTDPAFWSEWREPKRPELSSAAWALSPEFLFGGGVGLLLLAVALAVVRRFLQK